jgi:hypothetical protein
MLLAQAQADVYSEAAKWFRLRRFQVRANLLGGTRFAGHNGERT